MSDEFKIMGFGEPPSMPNNKQVSSSGIKSSTMLFVLGLGIAVIFGAYYLNYVSENKQKNRN